jgi:hypothetical protein
MSVLKNVYLVVMDDRGLFAVVYDRNIARRQAEAIGGVVAAVPILEDYRAGNAVGERTGPP